MGVHFGPDTTTQMPAIFLAYRPLLNDALALWTIATTPRGRPLAIILDFSTGMHAAATALGADEQSYGIGR